MLLHGMGDLKHTVCEAGIECTAAWYGRIETECARLAIQEFQEMPMVES